MLSAFPDFVMHMRPRGFSGGAHIPDDFPPLYPLAYLHEVHFVMSIDGGKSAAVFDHDKVAAAVFQCGIAHDSIGGYLDRGPRAGRDINAGMKEPGIADRVFPRAILGGNSSLDRKALGSRLVYVLLDPQVVFDFVNRLDGAFQLLFQCRKIDRPAELGIYRLQHCLPGLEAKNLPEVSLGFLERIYGRTPLPELTGIIIQSLLHGFIFQPMDGQGSYV